MFKNFFKKSTEEFENLSEKNKSKDDKNKQFPENLPEKKLFLESWLDKKENIMKREKWIKRLKQ